MTEKTNQKTLKPIDLDPEIAEAIEKELLSVLKKEFYLPLLREVSSPQKTLQNSSSALEDALRSGRIYFYRGQFKGRFNSKVSLELKRLGARWNKEHGSFSLSYSNLPSHLRDIIDSSGTKFDKTVNKLSDMIKKISPENIADKINLDKLFDKQIFKIDNDIDKQVKQLTVYNKLTKEQRERIAKAYTNNMKLYIKDWTEKEIVSLREKVKENVGQGVRYEELVKTISRSYGVSESKAKFLARQETNLLNTELQKERFISAGSREYEWQCVVGSKDHPVRPMHKKLDRKIIQWDNPPIVNEKGDRKHAGQDFNCRCRAKPIIKF